MGPQTPQQRTDHDLFRMELVNLIDQRYELVRLAGLINWQAFADEWSPQFVSRMLTRQTPKIVLTDRGYRGVEPSNEARLLISHTRRLPKRLKKLLKRRQVVEPMIGHMKPTGCWAATGCAASSVTRCTRSSAAQVTT